MSAAQFGFDFAQPAPAHALGEAGEWLPPVFRAAEIAQLLTAAQLAAQSLQGDLKALLVQAVGRAAATFVTQQTRTGAGDDELMALWRVSWAPSEDEAQAIRAAIDRAPVGCEVKRRSTTLRQSWVLFVPAVGTVSLSTWGEQNRAIDYVPWRDRAELAPSYTDGAAVYECPASAWRPAYSAQVIAEAREDVASVPVFVFGGRSYVIKGSVSSPAHGLEEASAFALVPLSEWPGVRLTYRSLVSAYDEGRLERGDARGLVVRVRGELCVLASFAVFRDSQPTPVALGNAMEHDDAGD